MNGTGRYRCRLWYRMVPLASDKMSDTTKDDKAGKDEKAGRKERITLAAMPLFLQRGYAGTSTLAIASAARLSKRDLYAEFPGKREIFAACIAERGQAMRAPLEYPAPREVAELEALLLRYGVGLRLGLADPKVIATYRVAVQEAPTAPDFARTLHEDGRTASFNAVVALLGGAQARGLLGAGAPEMMARVFMSVLVGDLMLRHLLCVAPEETAAAAAEHAAAATGALFGMYGTGR